MSTQSLRNELPKAPAQTRLQNFVPFEKNFSATNLEAESARCYNCGIAFCHNACPLNNRIPQWCENTLQVNDAALRQAWESLISTNPFPEWTGILCPAPCETSCVQAMHGDAVNIRGIERTLFELAHARGWTNSHSSPLANRFKLLGARLHDRFPIEKPIAVIGSGPAGLVTAWALSHAGLKVHVFEKQSKIGGLLRRGTPDFKFKRELLDFRIAQLSDRHVVFFPNNDFSAHHKNWKEEYAALAICIGAQVPRTLSVPFVGHTENAQTPSGFVLAMDFLSEQNEREAQGLEPIDLSGKSVVIIGGGDTASDCLGTALRCRAKSVTQLNLNPDFGPKRPAAAPWPSYYRSGKLTSSQEEGGVQKFNCQTTAIVCQNNHVSGVEASVEEENVTFAADLIIIGIGFVAAQTPSWLLQEELERTVGGPQGKHLARKDVPLFYAGDCRRGPSLIVWAMREGLNCAREILEHLNCSAAATMHSQPPQR